MKKRYAVFLLGLLISLVGFPVSAAMTIEAELSVQDDTVVRQVDYMLLGAGSEWGTDGGVSTFPQSTELSAQYLAAAEKIHRMPVARTAGASMNYFFWENSIGPYEQRKLAGKGIWSFTGPTNFGPVEWVKSNLAIDPDCQFIVGLNLLTESAEENADYAEFMTGDASVSELGARRKQYGLDEPVKVAAFELGNELDWGDISLSAEEYCRRAKKSISAIRERVPDAKFIACGKTYPYEEGLESMNWRGWNRTVLAELGGEIDYLSHHCYYDGQALAKTDQYLDVMSRDIKEITGSDRIKIALTEQARWPSNGASGDAATSDSNALTGVLSTADFLNRMYSRTDVWSANYFLFPGALEGYWGMAGPGRNEKKWYLSGVTQLYNLYGDELGQQVVNSAVTSDNVYAKPGNNNCKFTALATADGNRLKLALTNKSSVLDVSLSFKFTHPYRLISQTVFTAPDSLSKVTGADTADIFSASQETKNVDKPSQVTVQKMSVTFLTLERMDGTAVPSDAAAQAVFNRVNDAIEKQEESALSEAVIAAGNTVSTLSDISPEELADIKLVARLIRYEPFASVRAFSDTVRGELAAMRLGLTSSAAETKEILMAENSAFRCDFNSAAALSAGDVVYERISGGNYPDIASVRQYFEESVVVEALKQAADKAEIKKIVDEFLECIGCDKGRYDSLVDKEGLYHAMLGQKTRWQTILDVRTFIDRYVSVENTAVVLEEDFEHLPLMEVYQKGKGKQIGDHLSTSWMINSWNNGVYTMIDTDPKNSANRTLKVKGVGTDFPLAVDLTGDTRALEQDQKITVDFMKTGGGAISCGLRFQSHNHGMDYYEATFPTWWYKPKFRKVVNDTETVSQTFGNDGQIDSDNWYTLTVKTFGGTVSYRVDRKGGGLMCEGTYTDPELFGQTGQSAGIQLIMLGDAGEVYFDNLRVENIEPFMDGAEPPQMLYLNTSCRRRILSPNAADAGMAVDGDPETVFTSGAAALTLDMTGAYPVRKVRLENLVISGRMGLYVSKDNQNWTRLALIGPEDVSGGIFELLNTSDASSYRFVKLQPTGGYSVGELTILTDASGKTYPVRLGGALYFEAHDTTGQGTVLTASGAAELNENRLSPVKEGAAEVMMSSGGQKFTADLTVLPPCGTASTGSSAVTVCVGGEYGAGMFAAFYNEEGCLLGAFRPELSGVNSNQDEMEFSIPISSESERGVLYSWRENLQPRMSAYQFWINGVQE